MTNQPSGNNYDLDKMIEKSKRKEPVKYMFLSKSTIEKISKNPSGGITGTNNGAATPR